MLPNENPAFAQANRDLLNARREMLNAVLDDPYATSMTISREEVHAWVDEIRTHIRAFDRYEVCFKDEQDTKNRYEKERMERRLEEIRKNK